MESLADGRTAEYRRCNKILLLAIVGSTQRDMALLRHLVETRGKWALFYSRDGMLGIDQLTCILCEAVYLLQAFDGPVVLRPLSSASKGGGECFNLVGYCYLHGYMQG